MILSTIRKICRRAKKLVFNFKDDGKTPIVVKSEFSPLIFLTAAATFYPLSKGFKKNRYDTFPIRIYGVCW